MFTGKIVLQLEDDNVLFLLYILSSYSMNKTGLLERSMTLVPKNAGRESGNATCVPGGKLALIRKVSVAYRLQSAPGHTLML